MEAKLGKSQRLAIIVYFCWKNKDMWEIFSRFFAKYWKECAYDLILVTDKYQETGEQYAFTKVVEIDDTWAKMIKEAVRQAATPYVMLWMDDYLLCDYISNADIEKQLERAARYHAVNLRLIESPACKGTYADTQELGYYQRGEAYSLSTQVGIWDAAFLQQLPDEWSAWDFERIASLQKAEKEEGPILASLDYTFPYEEGVRKGKWMQQGAKLCRQNGIKLDTSRRPVMTNLEMAKIYFQGAILDWNGTLVVKVQNLLGKLGS